MSHPKITAARSEALFLSDLQPSQRPSAEQVRAAIQRTVRTIKVRDRVARFAQEYGDHPEIAIPRMRWALEAVSKAYRETPERRATAALAA